MRLHTAARSNSDKRLGVVIPDQFIHVNRQGRHAHPGTLDGHTVAFPCAGKAQHAAHFIDQYRVFQKRFGGPFGAVWITGHKDRFSDFARLCADMNCHYFFPLFRRQSAQIVQAGQGGSAGSRGGCRVSASDSNQSRSRQQKKAAQN